MADQTDREYQLYDAARAQHSRLLSEFAEDDDLIEGRFHVLSVDGMEEDLDITRPPTARNAVDNAADHILTTPKIRVPVRPSKEKQEEAKQTSEAIQQFLSMQWERWFDDHGDPYGQAVRSLIRGKAVLKFGVDWRLIPDTSDRDKYRRELEKVGKYRPLLSLEYVPRENVIEDFSKPWDPGWAFEGYRITRDAAERLFAKNKTPMPDWFMAAGPLDKVDYLEYWEKPGGDSRGKFIQWIEGERIHTADNPYHWETAAHTKDDPDYDGFLPYEIGSSGWGEYTKDQEPERYYTSIIRPIRSVVVGEARALTIFDYGNRYYVFKPMITKGLGDKELRTGPGAVWEIPQDATIDILQFGEIPVSLLQYMQRVGQYVDETAKLGSLGGTAQRGVDTATEAAQNSSNAATKLSAPIKSAIRMARRINTKALQTIEHVIEAPVTLYGTSSSGGAEARLTPSDINGFYATRVELGTSDEEVTNTRNLLSWANAAQGAPISWRTVLTKGGVENPTDEMLERMVEDLERSDPAKQVLLLTMLAGLGENGQAVSDALRQTLPAALSGGSGVPPSSTPAPAGNAPTDQVEATRTTARDEAIQNQPERQQFA